MLKDVSGIKFAGGNFNSSTEIHILDPIEGNKVKLVKGTILYGRNGAGKSTFAKAVKKIIRGGYPHIIQSCATDKDGNEIVLTDEEKARIFVFDEEFVDQNIKLQEAGLNTIVMLGQQADLTNQIAQAQTELDTARQEYEEHKNIVQNEYQNKNNSKSPQYFINQMRLALQGDDNWAGRDKIIKGGRTNTSVKEDTYKQFVLLTPLKSRDELIVIFNEKLKELQQVQKGDAVINAKVPTISTEYDDATVRDLLAVKIEKPTLSEREKYLLQLMQEGRSEILMKMVSDFGRDTTQECPYCLQPVSNEYKKNLVGSIQKVLNEIVKEHQQELHRFIIDEIRVDFSEYDKLGNKKIKCEDIIEKINQVIRENNKKLQIKIDDPYTPIETEITTVASLLDELAEALASLEEDRLKFNGNVQDTIPIRNELTAINSEIAYYDIVHLEAQYRKQKQEYEEAIRKQEEMNNIFIQKQNIVDELDARRRSIQIALNVINNSLKYIFFSEDRLRIEFQDDAYVLLSNGHAVKPSEVSLGERNIIALCYFFANIMQNQDVSTTYNREYLLVVDDPISSFDMENKVGIMSFLKYQLSKFLLGNIDTRAVVMTHDLLTFYDFNKVFDELIENCKEKFQGQKVKFNRYELTQQRLEPFEYKNRHEYTELIKIIYNYACGNANEYEIIIGNILRQVLEAFATFQYKKGIERVSTDPNILDTLPDEEYKSYFDNLMYRLVLHGGSHREEQIKALDDMNFFGVVSSADKQRTARDVLCYIYLLNEKHIEAHLKDCGNDAITKLNQWCNDIKTRTVV